MLVPVTVAALGAVAYTLRSVEPARLKTWAEFSTPAAVLTVVALFAQFAVTSWVAVIAASQAVPDGQPLSWPAAVGAVIAAQAAARRLGSPERGGTLLLGLTDWTLKVADRHVEDIILLKVEQATRDQLLVYTDRIAARLLEKVTSARVAKLADIRRQRDADLTSSDPHKQAFARAALESEVASGWVEYRMGPLR